MEPFECEREGGVGRKADPVRGHADRTQQVARPRIANGKKRGRLANTAREAPGMRGIQRAEPEPVEREWSAGERREHGRPRVKADPAVLRRQEGARVHPPVVLKEAAAADDHEIALPHLVGDRRRILPRHRVHAMPIARVIRIAGDHDEPWRRLERAQPREERGENGLIPGVAETVVAGDESRRAAHRRPRTIGKSVTPLSLSQERSGGNPRLQPICSGERWR
jgi:hypothetical protein